MVEITQRAEELLLELRGKHGYDQTDGVRFETAAGKIRLAFASEARPADRVLDGARLPIYVAPELADRFREAKIDAELTDGRQKIVVTQSRPAV
jgi:hypothetical protein